MVSLIIKKLFHVPLWTKTKTKKKENVLQLVKWPLTTSQSLQVEIITYKVL